MWILIVPAALALVCSAWLPKAPVAASAAPEPENVTEPPTSAIQTVPPAGPNIALLTWALAIAFGCWTLTDDGIYALVELLAEENIAGIDVDFVARTLGFSTLCGLTGAIVSSLLRRTLGRAGALAFVFIVSIVAKLALTLGTTQWLLVLGLCGWDFAFGALIPLVFGLAARAAIDGSVSVATNGVYVYGVALGPLFGTFLFSMGGGMLVSVVMGLIGAVTATVVVIVARIVESHVDKVVPDVTDEAPEPDRV